MDVQFEPPPGRALHLRLVVQQDTLCGMVDGMTLIGKRAPNPLPPTWAGLFTAGAAAAFNGVCLSEP